MKVIRRRNSESSRQLSIAGLPTTVSQLRDILFTGPKNWLSESVGRVVVYVEYILALPGVSGDLPRCNPRPLWLERGTCFFDSTFSRFHPIPYGSF